MHSCDLDSILILMTLMTASHSFGPLGTWRVSVSGRWQDNGGGLCAEASFQTFSTKPLSFLGMSTEVRTSSLLKLTHSFLPQTDKNLLFLSAAVADSS